MALHILLRRLVLIDLGGRLTQVSEGRWCCPLAVLLLLLATESLRGKQCLPGILHDSDLARSPPQGEHGIQPSPGASVGRIP